MYKISKLDIKAGFLTLAFILSFVMVVILVANFPMVAGLLLSVTGAIVMTSATFVLIRNFLE